jgi:pimeloyl-ACP methyl ester carboxylesterase
MSTLTAIALPGMSESKAEWAAAVELALDPGARILAEMPADGAVVLMGHSYGALRALELAAAHPLRARAVVLTGAFFPPARGGRTLAATAWDYGRHRVHYLRATVGRGRAPRPTRVGARQLASLARLGVRPRRFHAVADAVRAPVLVVHGEQDHVVPVAFARAAAEAHPGWTYREMPDAAHFVHRDSTAMWAETVSSWIDALE